MFLILACTNAPDPVADDSAAIEVTTELTYYADIKPLVDGHCTRCHNEGGLGPGDFSDPDEVIDKAALIQGWTEALEMPPPVSDPECRSYVGREHLSLDADEQAMISEWVEGGAPLGDEGESVEIEVEPHDLSDADLTVLMSDAYTPSWWDDGNPGNEYRCFVLDPGLDEDVYLTAMDPVVDNDAIVHHIVLLNATRDSVTEEMSDPAGWDCIDGTSTDPTAMVAAWAPGMMPIEFPEGYGMKLPADEVLIAQMHYYDPGDGGGPDQSGYAFKTAESVSKEVLMVPMGIGDFEIPAGDASYADGGSFVNSYFDFTIHGVFPHMHQLGIEYSMSVEGECLVEGRYSFDNQLTYMFDEPVAFPKDSAVEFECVWDNSEGPNNPEPQATGYGERTDEEMCFFFTLISFGAP